MIQEEPNNLLSEEEVGALFEAVKPARSQLDDLTAQEATGDAVPFVPRSCEDDAPELGQLLARMAARLSVEAGAALAAMLRLQVSVTAAEPIKRNLKDLSLSNHETLLTWNARGQTFGAIVVPEEIVKAVADRLLGGPGQASAPDRALSPLERRIAERPLRALAEGGRTGWRGVDPSDIAPTVAFDAILRGPCESILLIILTVNLGELVSEAALVYFVDGVRALCEVPTAKVAGKSARTVHRSIDRVPLKVRVLSGGFVLSVRELLELEVGQALALGHAEDFKLDVTVEGRPRFRGHLGGGNDGRRLIIDELLN